MQLIVHKVDSGRLEMYVNEDGDPHNTDGPAIIHTTEGFEEVIYMVDGRYHRVDGPAIVIKWRAGCEWRYIRQYYVNGEHIRDEHGMCVD